MTTLPSASAGLMSWSTWWALSAAKSSASARGDTWSPCSTSSRICSPRGVPPGCRVTTTSRPCCWSTSVSRCTWVVLPAPSPPSKHTKSPGAVSARWVAAARFSVTARAYATPPSVPVSARQCPSAPGEELLGDLDGVEGRALAQVVADDEEHEALALRGGLVGADPADEDLVAAGGLERVGHVGDDDAGGVLEQVERLVGRDVPLELGVDGEAVAGENRHAHARARDAQV